MAFVIVVAALFAAVSAEQPCCQGHCSASGMAKYWSIAKAMGGSLLCGECCMTPERYSWYHLIEKNMTKADSDTPCKDHGYGKYVSTLTHEVRGVNQTLDVYDISTRAREITSQAAGFAAQAVVESVVNEPCCQGHCSASGMAKYWSFAKAMDGSLLCGECCMTPERYSWYHLIEKNLTKADSDTPCKDHGYGKYESTLTHEVFGVNQSLDVYNISTSAREITSQVVGFAPEAVVESAANEPCCQGVCKEPGMAKYFSIASSALGKPHCGECCMKPSSYGLFHLFEANLTKADTDTPCMDRGYGKYDSTVTHGVWPIKMTLDLYDLPKLIAAEPCCQGTCKEAGQQKYWRITKGLHGEPQCVESCVHPDHPRPLGWNFVKSHSATPCYDSGYAKYVSTVTGPGEFNMTLDLFDWTGVAELIF